MVTRQINTQRVALVHHHPVLNRPKVILIVIPSYHRKLIKMRAKLANLDHCAVPFLSHAATNLSWYDIIPDIKMTETSAITQPRAVSYFDRIPTSHLLPILNDHWSIYPTSHL